ncbi:SDR family oxidoreductase [Paremcibacter congregatus]|uniref:SDR family oxidoreductase n=1 Tax=Paremcibacter congregatus TaxID=2043170 RepID=UPI003A93E851
MKTALVTGAAGDIGHAICTGLINQNIQVAALDMNQDALAERNKQLASPFYLPLVANILQLDSVADAVEKIHRHWGPVNILINNAGGITQGSLRNTTENDWMQDIDLNLNGPWRCVKAVEEDMISAGEGQIINIASVNGVGIYGHPGYSAAKAGLIHLTKFIAVEYGPLGVRSTAICPGSVKTQAWKERQVENPNILENATKWYPSRDICDPDDVANLVIYLACKAPKMMNGSIIPVDGGLTSGQDILAKAFSGE